ncbi:MAG: peroxide stress protein YaaA [Flavobacteriales bacterium]|jgi:cytoplasmic iron level regulating protein YaaA (DUF328/UPF0246 family)
MAQLIAVISPAKLIDDQSHFPHLMHTEAPFLPEAEKLVQVLKKKTAKDLGKMMDLSVDLSELNKRRYSAWQLPFHPENALQAILMFKGDVYRGMEAHTFTKVQLNFAQKHLRILSGLYGILRPMDLIQPYRLMMGTPFQPDKKTPSLYAFWQKKVTAFVQEEVDEKGVLVNLASQEYFKAIDVKALNRRVVHCEFKEKKGDKYTIVSTYAKLARGYMAKFIVENKITQVEHLKAFDTQGYRFNAALSSENNWVFSR